MPLLSVGTASASALPSIPANTLSSVKDTGFVLLEEDVLRETRLEYINKFKDQYIYNPMPLRIHNKNNLHWLESPEVATLPKRVEFINRVAKEIIQIAPDRFKPLIIVSLGAGGMLTEYYLRLVLGEYDYKYVCFKSIDVGYAEKRQNFSVPGWEDVYHYPKEIRSNFMKDQLVMKDQPGTQCFVSEEAYFNEKMKGGSLLAEWERTHGNVVLLSICPTKETARAKNRSHALSLQYPDKHLFMRGRIVASEHANCIYVFGCKEKNKDIKIDQRKNRLEDEAVIPLSNIVKISINDDGTWHMEYPKVHEVCQNFVSLVEKNLPKKFDFNKINDLYKVVLQLTDRINKFIKSSTGIKYYYEAFPANEFDRSMERIKSFFNPVLCAGLLKDEIFIGANVPKVSVY